MPAAAAGPVAAAAAAAAVLVHVPRGWADAGAPVGPLEQVVGQRGPPPAVGVGQGGLAHLYSFYLLSLFHGLIFLALLFSFAQSLCL